MEKTNTAQTGTDWKKLLRQNYSILVVIAMIIIFTILEPNFLNSMNIVNLLSDSAPLMVMAAGMTPILILGSIDLSLGSMCSVANVLMLQIMLKLQPSIENPHVIFLVALVLTLGFGVLGGIILGVIHVKLKVPSFIASPIASRFSITLCATIPLSVSVRLFPFERSSAFIIPFDKNLPLAVSSFTEI